MVKSLLTLFVSFSCAVLSAQERERRATIREGDSITAALAVLRECRIEFHHHSLAMHIPDKDCDFYVCYPDENRTYVALFFSKSRGKIQSMTAITFPHRQSGRIERVWTEIRSLTLGKDKSYSIEFLPTIPLREKPADVYPPFPPPTSRPPFARPPSSGRPLSRIAPNPPGGVPFAAPQRLDPPPSSFVPIPPSGDPFAESLDPSVTPPHSDPPPSNVAPKSK